ncbi:cytochrome c oxidase accessory protein CcoG [Verminephrobacter aporrectodeae]|uniref:cytochrome c oxidase accessory protein CcoG n=1 Tax=Verminephrobacter aporrectodeae TaxID=1110389 RepID=UPI002238F13A|nr:cytochrome c oxidase accessory protein CcoG [Verminephrobacter aporrectodeae]MCW5223376.1 cytochrome c oxidase accessory protein CcoG [Verminephrobacter aporrectodeae subsp. tuberculatae]MCW5288840.1 cytochrome c oxidase accessory protein CcoG [Verminephrobacter aporrectodeae subsp. tuberculatae]MCW8175070.1 cytochrome c oxidase accessory protein CcoG [Verminephrobacter aporrectodeae subsp. tuberculatae]MCW8202372.1 cytochrome c oxidase accessory protein CcoG [Verminephrobacter aporrectodeae
MQPSTEPARKSIPIVPVASDAPSGDAGGSLYEAQKKIHPRSIDGPFARWRWAMVLLTQLVFYGLPWFEWGQRQMVLFDLGARRFYMFGLVLYPQDFIYLTGLLIISALALFLFTAVAGRLWCGFACPQTVYTEIFLWVEHRIEGDRSARLRLDKGPWTWEKLRKKGLKQIVWIALALWTGLSFVGYFVPIRELGSELLALQGGWQIFWVLFYGFATYGNAGFMREQVCKYMCPYARFQGAMFDPDTLIVSYDAQRGEPRGARGKAVEPKASGLGDCIDCTLCVQVCPVGIDIRQGLQYECIGCGLCVDACNGVMDKMQYPRGLIRYATQNGVARRWSQAQMLRRVLRPRVLIYGALLAALSLGMLASLLLRTPLKVDVLHDRAALARIVAGGRLENIYRLQIMNATEQAQRYRIAARGLEGLALASDAEVDVGAAQSRWIAVRLQIPYGSEKPGAHAVHFDVQALGAGARVTEKSVFLVPR